MRVIGDTRLDNVRSGFGQCEPAINDFRWGPDSSGQWETSLNWGGGPPNSNTQTALLGDSITAPRTVTVDSPVTVKNLTFDNLSKYVVGGTGTVNFSADSGNPSVNVLNGNHEVAAKVAAGGITNVTVTSGSLDFNNEIDLAGNTLNILAGSVGINHRTTGGGAVVNSGTLGTAGSTPLGGDLTSIGTLVIDLGENNTDMFDVAGAATLSGVLQLVFEPGFTPHRQPDGLDGHQRGRERWAEPGRPVRPLYAPTVCYRPAAQPGR